MASVKQLIIKSKDTSENNLTEKMYTTFNMEELLDSSTGVASTINTFARAVTSLTTNTYQDTTLSETKSINEALEEFEP